MLLGSRRKNRWSFSPAHQTTNKPRYHSYFFFFFFFAMVMDHVPDPFLHFFWWPQHFCLFTACINRPTVRTAATLRKHIHNPRPVMAQQASASTTSKGTLDPSSIARKEDETQQPLYDPRSLQYLEPTQSSLQCSVCCEYFTEPVSAPCGYASFHRSHFFPVLICTPSESPMTHCTFADSY